MPSTNNTNLLDQPAISSMNSPEQKSQTSSLSSQRDVLPDLEHDVTSPEPSLAPVRCPIRRYLKHPVPLPRPRPRPRPEVPELEAWRIPAPASADPRAELVISRCPLPMRPVDAPRGSHDVSYYVNRGFLSVSRRLQPQANQAAFTQVDREHRAGRTAQGAPLVSNETPSVFLLD
jgi:hypothetical protein